LVTEHIGSVLRDGESEDLVDFESQLRFSPIADRPQINSITLFIWCLLLFENIFFCYL